MYTARSGILTIGISGGAPSIGAVTHSWCRIGMVASRSPRAPTRVSIHAPTAITTVVAARLSSLVSTPTTRLPRRTTFLTGAWVRIFTPKRRARRATDVARLYGSAYASLGIHAHAFTVVVSRSGTRF